MRKLKVAPKLQHFIQDVFDSGEFRHHVENLRDDIDIPVDTSLEFTEEDSIQLDRNPSDYFPFLLKRRPVSEQKKIKTNINLFVNNKLAELPLPWPLLGTALKLFIFHNMYSWENIPVIADSLENTKLITLTDEKTTFFDSTKRVIDDLSSKNSRLEREYLNTIQKRLRDYPVVLWVSPIAGKNEILRFIDDNWSNIEKMQSGFLQRSTRTDKFMLMKSLRKRSPEIQKKIRTVLDMKNKATLSKIAGSINAKFPHGNFMHSGDVGKIISKKKKLPTRLKRTPLKT